MPWVIGTDEAGYGPNLGPLVVGATTWHYGGLLSLESALAELAAALNPAAPHRGNSGVTIADSKRLYSPSSGLSRLEGSLLAALAACGLCPRDWRDVWTLMAPDSVASLDQELACATHGATWPVACQPHEVPLLTDSLLAVLKENHWRLAGVLCRPMFPSEFNAAVRRLGNKAHVLSQTTLDLAATALSKLPAEDTLICCDKHGGRNHYAGVLQHCFADGWITPRTEGNELSAYDCQLAGRQVRIEFRARGESLPPTALASMAAKYLRELAMQAFNAFWSRQVKGLRPTAGYPLDAARFREEVRAARESLGIDVNAFWRER